MPAFSEALREVPHLVLQRVRLVVVDRAVEGDNDDVGLPVIGPREGGVGRPQPGALRVKGVAGREVCRLKCTCPPDGLVREPAPVREGAL